MVQRKGIDVSVHNGLINWDKVKADGIEFAMIRLGVGSNDPNQDDAYFERNASECERVGIDWGVYIYSYALTPEEARSERDHALRLLQGKHPSYPVAFDMEDADGYKERHGMPPDETLVDICYTFLNDVEQAGYYVILYASKSWLDNQLRSSKLDRFDKWVAQWSSACSYGGNYSMWQYTNMGSVNGIVVDGVEGIDMNYSYRDYAQGSPAPISQSSVQDVRLPDDWKNKMIGTLLINQNMQVNIHQGNSFDATISRVTKGGQGHAVFEEANGMYRISVDEWITANPTYVTYTPLFTKKWYVKLPATDDIWRFYPVDAAPVRENAIGELHPSKFGGLEYEILVDHGFTSDHQDYTYEIQTQDFGRVKIYAGPETGATIYEK